MFNRKGVVRGRRMTNAFSDGKTPVNSANERNDSLSPSFPGTSMPLSSSELTPLRCSITNCEVRGPYNYLAGGCTFGCVYIRVTDSSAPRLTQPGSAVSTSNCGSSQTVRTAQAEVLFCAEGGAEFGPVFAGRVSSIRVPA